VPVGAFLILHLWTYGRAIGGKQALDEVASDRGSPYLWLVEAVFIWLPLAFHAAYGLKLGFGARANVGRYPYTRNWMYVLERATGIVALIFLVYHLLEYRIPLALGKLTRADLFEHLCASMSATSRWGIPVAALAYLLGIAACTFHLANGLYGVCFSWGVTTSERATRLAAGAFGVLGIVLFALGANTVIYFATGSRLVWSARDRQPGSEAFSCAEVGRDAPKASLDAHDRRALALDAPGESSAR
jgi:succinate dehydrogenase / fumarate reductase cytochrome b subunit